MHKSMWYTREFHWCSLVEFQYFGRWDSNEYEAPDSLTGCGHASAKGFFDCTSAMLGEVRLAEIPEFHRGNCY